MTAPLRVPVRAARRLAVEAQRLDGPPPRRRPGRDEVLAVCDTLGCLQLDPIGVVARSHLIVLFSRLGPFDEALLERLVYGERMLFEYWAHEASIVRSADLPLHAWRMRTPARRGGAWQARVEAWWADNAVLRAHVLARLDADGPLAAREIEDRSVRPWTTTGWSNERNVARMLDLMWVRGQVGVARRDGGRRLWDRLERCLPAGAPREELSDHEVTRRAAQRALRMLGVARAPHIRAHFTRGRYPGLPAVLAELEREGAIVPVAVAGLDGDWWVHASDAERLAALAAADAPRRPRTVLLSPFDNLLCDRARTEQLFGFSHRLEIYTPKARRRWGYFVLPILRGERLIGRADLSVDRRAGRLVATAVHRETGAPNGRAAGAAVRRELERLAAWRGATEIELGSVPEAWREGLAGAG